MKILHVIAGLAPQGGGPHKAAPELCRALACKGHKVTIFTTNADGKGILNVPTDRPVLWKGVAIRYFPVSWPRRWVFSLPLARALKKNIRAFDIIHVHSLYLFHTFITAHYCRQHGVTYLICPHGTLDPFLRRKSRWKKAIYNFFIEKRNLDHAAAIHYTSQEEMSLAHYDLKIRAPGVVVPLGLELEEYAALPSRGSFRSQFPEIGDKFLILFLGRINFKKGLDILVRAYEIIARQRKDVHLVIAGPDNEGYGRKVRKWLTEEGVLERVTVTGMILGKTKLAALRDADVFVLPSYTENFGVAVVEAMACGLPVVISNKVNIWNEVTGAEAGVVVNCKPNELAEALLELLDDPEYRKSLGKNGKKLVSAKFTWDKVAERMIKVYENILGKA